MKMSLEEAKKCMESNPCGDCRFKGQDEFDCRDAAFEIAVSCINYCLVGKKLTSELEGKER